MPTRRQKFNFYAVTKGKNVGIYTSWPQTGDAVLGIKNARFKGFGTYNEALNAMLSEGYGDFSVFDGQSTYSRTEYEQTRTKPTSHSNIAGNEEADKLANYATESVLTSECITPTEDEPEHISHPKKCPETEDQQKESVDPKSYNEKASSPIKTSQDFIRANTPIRRSSKNKSETPVPGSVNGSYIKIDRQSKPSKNTLNTGKEVPPENDKNIRIMQNMESVLQNILFELHHMKENNADFKREMNTEVRKLHVKHESIEKSIKHLSCDITSGFNKCFDKIDRMGHTIERENTVEPSEIKQEIQIFQDKVEKRIQGVTNTIQTVETAVATLKDNVRSTHEDNSLTLQNSEIRQAEIQETVQETRKTINETKEKVIEIEKSLSSLANQEQFIKPTKTTKNTVELEIQEEGTLVSPNRFEKLSQSDPEIEVRVKHGERKDQKCTDEVTKKSQEIIQRSETQYGSTQSPKIDQTGMTQNDQKNVNLEKQNYVSSTHRKDKVYVIGDSIAGQINPAKLGKSTNTFIKYLRASKIEDIEKISHQVNDARLVIIHCGINNIRDKQLCQENLSNLVSALEKLTEIQPHCKIVVSKLIPTGDCKIKIDSNVHNANLEKRLAKENYSKAGVVDHGNLADQGEPIPRFYRRDLLHLSPDGVDIFAENLREIIMKEIGKGQSQTDRWSEISSHPRNEGQYRYKRGRDQNRDRHWYGDRRYKNPQRSSTNRDNHTGRGSQDNSYRYINNERYRKYDNYSNKYRRNSDNHLSSRDRSTLYKGRNRGWY